jgi:hypothetical protein
MAMCISSASALAEDLFDGTTIRGFRPGSLLAPGTTMGGYPIFQGDNRWRIGSIKTFGPNNFGVTYGTLQVVQYDGNVYAAEMITSVNVNQSGEDFYLTSNNCGGEHLVVVNKATAGRGDSAWDNCLTIDPYVATIGSTQFTTLHFRVTNSQEGGRYYETNLLINTAALGFPESSATDWSAAAVAASPEKKRLIDKATTWGKQLQTATKAAMAWSKPKDAFANVASWRSLASNAAGSGKSDLPEAEPVMKTSSAQGQSVSQRVAR